MSFTTTGTAIKGRKFPAEPLTADEVERLMGTFGKRAPTSIRNAAMTATMYRGGLRVGETLALQPKDLDPSGTLRVLHGKRGRTRVVALDPWAMAFVTRWLDVRAKFMGRRRGALFVTLDGRPISPNYVREMLKRKARQAGIERRCHPHALRHGFATEMLSEGHDIVMIQHALGHASTATTAVYLDHLQPEAVIEAMRNRVATPQR